MKGWRHVALLLALATALSAFLTACGGGTEEAERGGTTETKGTLTFGFTPWTTTYPGTYIAKHLIEEHYGWDVALQDAEVGVIYQGLNRGDIDVFMDSWLPLLHADYMKANPNVVDAGTIYTDAILGWGVPAYLDKGLQSIADLNEYVDLFDGKVTGIDAGAGMSRTSKEVIEAYGLDYEYVPSSEAAMLTAMADAFQNEEPILFLVYRPHSMFQKWEIRVLDDPKGIWESSEVHVVVNKELEEKAPEVYAFLSRFQMPIEDYEWWIAEQEEGADPDALAEEWIAQHPEQVKAFLGEE